MDWLLNLVLIAMACQAIVRIWFYADLFAKLREFIKLRLDAWAEESVRTPETVIQAHLAELASQNGEVTPPPVQQPVRVVRVKLSWEVELFRRIAPKWIYSLLSCQLCLSTHVALWLLLVCQLTPMVLDAGGWSLIGLLFRLPVHIFAVVYLADALGALTVKMHGNK